jgi:hypothetical protein
MQRLTTPDGAKWPPAHIFRPVSSQKQRSSMRVPAPGGPLARVPNSSPSQVRFKELIPMSRSCDLFYEGPHKHHPHALGLDELF